MCGILFSTLYDFYSNLSNMSFIDAIKHRGPDNTKIRMYKNINGGFNKYIFAFHRLAINDTSSNGNQPFSTDDLIWMINGQIYNYEQLEKEHNITHENQLMSYSDCEIVGYLYKKYGFDNMIKMLHGVFAIVLFDIKNQKLYAARDRYGVRSMYYTQHLNENRTIAHVTFASEAKALDPKNNFTNQFPPGHYTVLDLKSYESNNHNELNFMSYYNLDINLITPTPSLHQAQLTIYHSLLNAVYLRTINTNRPIGFLLSGGLDSSIICGLAATLIPKNIPIYTFSIGIKNKSTDFKYAQMMANHINSIHTEVYFTEEEAFNTIPEIINVLETYDTTTIRASIPMYLLAKYIKQNTDIKVLLSGEGSDEITGGYLYFKDAPSPHAFDEECQFLMNNIHYYDGLRADKTIASQGLELRVPFMDPQFIESYWKLLTLYRDPKYNNNNIEKYQLRYIFGSILPNEIFTRTKDAFSDSVGRSWKDYIQERLGGIKEEKEYYKQIFIKYFGEHNFNNKYMIPGYWMPKWQDINLEDPSATKLTSTNKII